MIYKGDTRYSTRYASSSRLRSRSTWGTVRTRRRSTALAGLHHMRWRHARNVPRRWPSHHILRRTRRPAKSGSGTWGASCHRYTSHLPWRRHHSIRPTWWSIPPRRHLPVSLGRRTTLPCIRRPPSHGPRHRRATPSPAPISLSQLCALLIDGTTTDDRIPFVLSPCLNSIEIRR